MASNFFRKFVLKFFIEIIIEIIEKRENGMAINSFRKFVLKFFIETDMANNSFRKFVLKFLVESMENRGKLENGNEKIVREMERRNWEGTHGCHTLSLVFLSRD